MNAPQQQPNAIARREQPRAPARPAPTPEDGLTRLVFEPASLDQAIALAERVVKSGLLPAAIKRPEDALIVMMTGRELGLTAMASFRLIHVIEGKPTMSSSLMIARCRESGLAAHITLVKTDNERCVYRTKRKSDREEVTIEWTIEDAKRAELVNKTNWKRYPRAMLRARCEAELCRSVYPEVSAGIYTPEEMGEVIDVDAREVSSVDERHYDRPPEAVEVLEASRKSEAHAEANRVREVMRRAVDRLGPDRCRDLVGDLKGAPPEAIAAGARRLAAVMDQEDREAAEEDAARRAQNAEPVDPPPQEEEAPAWGESPAPAARPPADDFAARARAAVEKGRAAT